MIRDGRFRWAAAVTLCLLTGALALGWQHYREVAAQHDLARQQTRQAWLTQGEKNPHSAAHYGVYAFKPRSPLSQVDHGVDPYVIARNNPPVGSHRPSARFSSSKPTPTRMLANHANILLLALGHTGVLSGQTTIHGSLSGRVTDPTGSGVPAVKLTLRSAGTEAQWSAVSTLDGAYEFPRLAAITQSRDSPVSMLIDEARIKELPLNSRDFQKLLFLAPGIGNQRSNNGATNNSTAGARDLANNYTVDGVTVNDERQTAGIAPGTSGHGGLRFPNAISTEAVREFRVITTNADATFGRGSGAQVNVITKSGTKNAPGCASRSICSISSIAPNSGCPTARCRAPSLGASRPPSPTATPRQVQLGAKFTF